MQIPQNIKEKIFREAKSEDIADQLILLCDQIYKTQLNVGVDQLIRSLLVLSDFEVDKVTNLIENKLLGDPRDIISMAQSKNKKNGWGLIKFEIE